MAYFPKKQAGKFSCAVRLVLPILLISSILSTARPLKLHEGSGLSLHKRAFATLADVGKATNSADKAAAQAIDHVPLKSGTKGNLSDQPKPMNVNDEMHSFLGTSKQDNKPSANPKPDKPTDQKTSLQEFNPSNRANRLVEKSVDHSGAHVRSTVIGEKNPSQLGG